MEKNLREILTAKGLKVTKTRVAILSYMLKTKEHPSAEMISNNLKLKGMEIPASTVYNVLDTFSEKGIIEKVGEDSDSMMRYDARTDFHIHIYNSSDNTIEDFDDEDLSGRIISLIEEIRERSGVPEDSKIIIQS